MLNLPSTPCDCLTVNPCAILCSLFVCWAFYRRRRSKLRQEELHYPRNEIPLVRRSADAVLLCDVLKITFGLLVAHCVLFMHEAIVSNGGTKETRYYYVVHMLRLVTDVVVPTCLALFGWSQLVRYANYLASRGGAHPSSVLVHAMRAGGRYNAAYALNWEDEACQDFRVDPEVAVEPHLPPSVLDQRVAALEACEQEQERRRHQPSHDVSEADGEEDDSSETAGFLVVHRSRRHVAISSDEGDSPAPVNPNIRRPLPTQCVGRLLFEPLPQWWYCQTGVWCALVFALSATITLLQVVWRELLQADDPLLLIVTKIIDASSHDGDFVCSGVENGVWVTKLRNASLPDWGIVLIEWLVLVLVCVTINLILVHLVYSRHVYRGRTVHPAFQSHINAAVQY